MPKLRTDLVQDCKIIEEVCEDLDDEFLRQHLGVEDLTKIDYLELIVCDEDQRVNSIGENMPHLERLKKNFLKKK